MQTTCCFLGHRNICIAEDLKNRLIFYIEHLIIEQDTDTFLFGSKSQFITLCYEIVTELKKKHPHIKRTYVRAEFPQIDKAYRAYLLERYENTYYPETVLGAGRSVYLKRNQVMIDSSNFCVFYFDPNLLPKGRTSGTVLALEYAKKQQKQLVIFP